jgi:hypothetical protein
MIRRLHYAVEVAGICVFLSVTYLLKEDGRETEVFGHF